MTRLLILISAALTLLVLAPPLPARADPRKCDAQLVASTIDGTASALRNLNMESEKRFQAKLAQIAKKKGWTQAQMAEHATRVMNDDKLTDFNTQIDAFVGQIDSLSATSRDQISCERLDELQAVRNQLLTVMGEKSGYMLARLDAELVTAAPATPPAAPAKVPPAPAPRPEARKAPEKPAAQSWETSPRPLSPLPQTSPRPLTPPATPAAEMPLPGDPQDGFTVQELRDAGKGIFGVISADLAASLDASFKHYGRPTGYITGDEGGGAFLAGLRYGKGELRMKSGGTYRVYWQGPSVGADLGANAAKMMFLVYRLRDASQIYRRFSGVEGTAYIAGGVGFTVLSAGETVIVPVRSGLGLRLGASFAYVKFTERATWNPF